MVLTSFGNSEAIYACWFTEILKKKIPTCVLLFDMFKMTFKKFVFCRLKIQDGHQYMTKF